MFDRFLNTLLGRITFKVFFRILVVVIGINMLLGSNNFYVIVVDILEFLNSRLVADDSYINLFRQTKCMQPSMELRTT